MGASFMLSPGVNVREFDITTVIPAVATTTGAIAGIFRWGPVGERMLIDSEIALIDHFGRPTSHNAETWFSAANFLSYGNSLYVTRSANTTSANTEQAAYNAIALVANGTANVVAQVVRNQVDYDNHAAFDTDVFFVAKYPGAMGNSLRVSVCDSANAYQQQLALGNSTVTGIVSFSIGANTASINIQPNGADNTATATFAGLVHDALAVGDLVLVGNSTINQQYMKITQISSLNTISDTEYVIDVSFDDPFRLHSNWTSNTFHRHWEFFNVVETAPGQSNYVAANGNTAAQDELHIVVVDENGVFTGVPGSLLEVYQSLSRATDAKNDNNTTIYYKEVINQSSRYMWWANDLADAPSATALLVATSGVEGVTNITFTGGTDGYSESTAPLSIVATGYDQYRSAEDVDVSILIQGKPIGGTTAASDGSTVENFQLANYLIDNICEIRKDCVAVVSPPRASVVNNVGREAQSIVNWRNATRSSSYSMIDSGWKYQYDRYNDVYRWIPMNADIAGLMARTDQTNDPWWSPAGFNRGHIKNIAKLAYNPRQADRDVLYKNGINPVVTFPGQGTVLFGDKTMLSKPSAFDRINVRRLFIVLEKAIATAAKFSLFEFNDQFTRAQFRNMVEPYLRDVKGRRGIYDFMVVCDERNNTPQVIDTNGFVADILIKPARSINFITLNFHAVGTGVAFSEIVGNL